ncbi:hypothetical protein [Mesorhizobium sp. KR9-304]|uniref:hypothetical protein n=1 Tax=Mesorhizobium sp. KR9-304 TaxID=3156614 RepID=UPI0032B60411
MSSAGTVGPLELFGTEEPPAERHRLVAGPLSAMLEDGNLRDIRFGGVEIVRAINYLARDASWGTFKPALSNLRIAQGETSFAVDYDGLCGEPGAGFSYTMRIRGEPSGRLAMEADGVALADFLTNRTGFVILHAAEAAGARMSLIHSDGTREETFFPLRISADQPAFDITAITHEAAPGVTCTVEMEGDAFEMEDQRNWADASFKTYVRPLSKPRPYVIAKGASDRQRIVVSVEGQPSSRGSLDQDCSSLTLGAPVGRMPAIALCVDDSGIGTLSPDDAPQILVARLDPEKAGAATELSRIAAFAKQGRASVAVELVLPAKNPEAEAAEALRLMKSAGLKPTALLVSPRCEFKTRPSNTLPDGEAPIDELVAALKHAGFAGKIGAGTPSYFTEFNRNPPGKAGDFVFFSVAAIVHAADDTSVAETLSVYPTLVESARALCPGKPVWLGPCTIGVRHNPYGSATQPNPSNGRVPSATIDPRQSALFAAAYAVAAAAHASASGVEAVILGSPVGPFGIMNGDGSPRPIKAIVAELTSAAGSQGHALAIGIPGIYGVAYGSDQSLRALVANLTSEAISSLPIGLGKARLLQSHAAWSATEKTGRLDLPPYRTALLSA